MLRHDAPRAATPAALAAAFWSAAIVSSQLPVTWQPTDDLYLSLQRGCAALWRWAPANRPSLGIRDHLTINADRSEPLAFPPFVWSDPWGFGIGLPLLLPAILLTALAVHRFAFAAVRRAPAPIRSTRHAATRWTLAAAVALTAFLLGLSHRTEPIAAFTWRTTLRNGSLVIEKEAPPALPPVRPTASVLVLTGTAPAAARLAGGEEPFVFDLLPHYATPVKAGPGWTLRLPLWPLVLVSTWMAIRTLRKCRHGPADCQGCGYNRSGLDAAAVCPECGTRPPGVPDSAPAA